MSRKPPRWDDVRAVERRVKDELAEAEYRGNVEDYEVPSTHLPPPSVPDFAEEQEAAIAAAERGDPEPMAHFVYDWMNPKMNSRAFFLLLNFLHAGTPKSKRKRGRPKTSAAARRRANPLHDAADETDRIFSVLRRLFSAKRKRDLMTRAIGSGRCSCNVARTGRSPTSRGLTGPTASGGTWSPVGCSRCTASSSSPSSTSASIAA